MIRWTNQGLKLCLGAVWCTGADQLRDNSLKNDEILMGLIKWSDKLEHLRFVILSVKIADNKSSLFISSLNQTK